MASNGEHLWQWSPVEIRVNPFVGQPLQKNNSWSSWSPKSSISSSCSHLVFLSLQCWTKYSQQFSFKKKEKFWVFRKLSNFLLFNFTSPSATRETTRGLTYIWEIDVWFGFCVSWASSKTVYVLLMRILSVVFSWLDKCSRRILNSAMMYSWK